MYNPNNGIAMQARRHLDELNAKEAGTPAPSRLQAAQIDAQHGAQSGSIGGEFGKIGGGIAGAIYGAITGDTGQDDSPLGSALGVTGDNLMQDAAKKFGKKPFDKNALNDETLKPGDEGYEAPSDGPYGSLGDGMAE